MFRNTVNFVVLKRVLNIRLKFLEKGRIPTQHLSKKGGQTDLDLLTAAGSVQEDGLWTCGDRVRRMQMPCKELKETVNENDIAVPQ